MNPLRSSPADPTDKAARHFILGTAGHIDHGKTALVKALSGTDTDRLPEEQRRGMTIELGFAGMQLGALHFGIVDVPGHERFVRTMVAGASGIDIALIVVAADDSVMPQTREHVEILHLLGVTRAVVAVTKIDVVDEEMAALVADEVRQLLAGTPLADAPIRPVSSITGQGLDALRDAIVRTATGITRPEPDRPFRMAVDRVFTVAGRGTVVTGSVLRGAVAEGETLEVWPEGATCRVRGLQTHGAESGAVSRGQRAAINVSGIDRERIQRGCELATPGYLRPGHMLDVRLRHLPGSKRPLKSQSVVRFEIGTMEVPARVVLLEGRSLDPGQSAYVQLRCGRPVTAVHGQRFILRDENAGRTLGGGMVLRPVAGRRRGHAEVEAGRLGRLEHGDALDRMEEVLRGLRFTRPDDLELCARAGVEPGEVGDILKRLREQKRYVRIADTQTLAVPSAREDLGDRLVAWLERHHRAHPELPGRALDAVLGWLERVTSRGLARPLLKHFVEHGAVKRLGRFVCAASFAPTLSRGDEQLLERIVTEIRAAGFQPPGLSAMGGQEPAERKRRLRLATLAVAMGELVQLEPGLFIHTEVERRLREEVASLIRAAGGVSVAQVREALGSTRKFVVPFLEYLDRVGFTKRVGDVRLLSDSSDG